MKATDQMTEEHNTIKVMLQVLNRVCEKLDSEKTLNLEHIARILEFVRGFADKFHHAKEEDLLFPAMEAAGIPREGGPIGCMLEEHATGRSFVKAMGEGLASYASNPQQAGAKIRENALDYIDLLTQHMFKEDNILYPMADNCMSVSAQEALWVECEKIAKAHTDKTAAFLKTLQDLKKIYLD